MTTDNYRVCNTPDLRVLVGKARSTSALSPKVNAQLDPEGTHVLNITTWGHNMDAGHPLQHKVKVMAKVIGTDEPEEFTIDMLDTDWKRLTRYSEVAGE